MPPKYNNVFTDILKKIQRNLCDRTKDNAMNHVPHILVANLVKSILIFPEKIIFTFPNFGLLYFF